MTFGSNVAPVRRVREKAADWTCECVSSVSRRKVACGSVSIGLARVNPGYLARCSDCGTRRP